MGPFYKCDWVFFCRLFQEFLNLEKMIMAIYNLVKSMMNIKIKQINSPVSAKPEFLLFCFKIAFVSYVRIVFRLVP